MTLPARNSEDNMLDLPISIHFGNEILDWGIATIPKAVLRFYRYLESDGERLKDKEMMSLVLLLTLGADREFQLRISNLPSASSVKTIQRHYLKKWRRMGLVQTTRQYYSTKEMTSVFGADNVPLTPRLKCVNFDLSGLIYNISLIAKEWTRQQHQAIVAWENDGRQGAYPVYEFPKDFAHEIVLSHDQSRAIRQGAYQFVPSKWVNRAHQMDSSVPDKTVPVRTDVPDKTVPVRSPVPDKTVPVRPPVPDKTVPVRPRTGQNSTGHLRSNVSNVSNVFPANAGAQSAHPVSSPPVGKNLSLSASSATGLPQERPAGCDVKGTDRPAEHQPQGREAPNLPQEHSARDTTTGGEDKQDSAQWEQLPSTAGLTVPEKVCYWEEAVARAKHNPGGCLCRAVNDLLGLKPNYGHAGKLAKHHGRMVVWRQIKKSLVEPPQGDFWAYIDRALSNNGESSSKSRETGKRHSWFIDPKADYSSWES